MIYFLPFLACGWGRFAVGLFLTLAPAGAVLAQVPTITSFAPNPGGRGQAVTLTGTNLTGTTSLLVNGVNATASITGNTATSLTFRIPLTAPASGTTTLTTAGGTATSPALAVLPAPGNALAFDGAGDYVVVPRPVSDNFTLEFWLNTTQTGPGGAAGQWYTGSGLVDAEVSGVANDFGTALVANKVAFGTGNPDVTIRSTTVINDGSWHHVAATREATTGTLRLYVDGVLEATATGGTVARTAPPNMRLGSLLTNLNFFLGRLDEVRMWTTVRSAAEIGAGMRTVPTVPQAGLVAYYNLDQGVPGGANAGRTTVYDLTAAAVGTLTGFALTGTASNWVESYALVVPAATTATAASSHSFTATWTAPAVGTVTNYVVEVSTSATFASAVTGSPFTVAAPANGLRVTGLTASTTYYYRVRANKTSVANQGAYSNVVTVATCALPVARTQPVTVTLDANGTATVTATAVNNGSTADCGAAPAGALSVTPTTFTCTNLGSNTVTLTVTDASGQTSAAPATVTVSVAPGLATTTWTGNASTDWADCRNWRAGQVPTATISALIPAGLGRYPATSTGTLSMKDLLIESGVTMTVGSGTALQINGNFTNNGTVSLSGSVAFVGGATTQLLGGTTETSFSTLVVNKLSGSVQLQRTIPVTEALTLTAGTLITDTYQVALGSAATVSETNASYVLGNVETTRLLNAAGTGSTFGGLGLTLTPSAASTALPGSTRVRRVTGTPLTGTGGSRSIARYFDIQATTPAGLDVTLLFAYFDHELNGLPPATLTLFKSGSGVAGPWANQSPVTRSANVVSKSGISSFSVWTLGDAAAPLPVVLTRFEAQAMQQDGVLRWATAQELNNGHFDVERGLDGRPFERIGRVPGQGTTRSTQTYAFTDRAVGATYTGLVYYRLGQVDTDGTRQYSPVRTVRFAATSADLRAYPNPITTVSGAQLDLTHLPAGSYQVQLVDLAGRALRHYHLAGGRLHALSLHDLPAGSYLVRVTGNRLNQTTRLSKQ